MKVCSACILTCSEESTPHRGRSEVGTRWGWGASRTCSGVWNHLQPGQRPLLLNLISPTLVQLFNTCRATLNKYSVGLPVWHGWHGEWCAPFGLQRVLPDLISARLTGAWNARRPRLTRYTNWLSPVEWMMTRGDERVRTRSAGHLWSIEF